MKNGFGQGAMLDYLYKSKETWRGRVLKVRLANRKEFGSLDSLDHMA